MALEEQEPSYGALLRIPGFGRLALGTVLGRLAAQMWEIALVLFVLQRYRSPSVAGLAVFLGILPGLAFSPIAGSLLDRQGRVRLMIFDYSVTAALTAAIAVLSLLHRLPVPLLLATVTMLSLSNILSITGTRSLFPLMVPRHLWDRSNGIDTSTYSFTSIIGPAVAGLLIARLGPEAALIAMAAVVGAAALSLLGVREPIERAAPASSLIRDSWAGLVYVVRNSTLRGLAVAMFFTNLAVGPVVLGIPLLVLHRLHGGADTVGQIWAVFGLAGLVAGLVAGRVRTEGRERPLIAASVAIQVPALVVLGFTDQLGVVFAVAALIGVASAISLVAIFALRQRRTDPAWFGRAFAVSMSLNMLGQPVGSALSGPLFERSLALPFLFAAAISVVGAVVTMLVIPARERAPVA